VAIGVGEENGGQGKGAPGVDEGTGPEAEGDEAGEDPDGLDHRYQGSLVCAFRQLRDSEQSADVEHGVRNREQVCMEGGEAERFEGQRDVGSWGADGDEDQQADGIERPEIIVAGCSPKTAGRDGLAVVHVAFGGVVA